jgi:hypothetical protein
MYNVDDTANQPIADAYGIVMGTSHTEPMMRASNEWPTFGKQYGGNGQWEYDTNNQSLIPFFTYGAQRAKPYQQNSLFTMAMVCIIPNNPCLLKAVACLLSVSNVTMRSTR